MMILIFRMSFRRDMGLLGIVLNSFMNGLRILGSEKKLKTFSVDLWWKLSKTLNKILNVGMNG